MVTASEAEISMQFIRKMPGIWKPVGGFSLGARGHAPNMIKAAFTL